MIYFLDDETRVVLETDAHNRGDYINASFINVRKTKIQESPIQMYINISYC